MLVNFPNYIIQQSSLNIFCVVFFFSSRRRHTRSCLVSWARRCVQETVVELLSKQMPTIYTELLTNFTSEKYDVYNKKIEVFKHIYLEQAQKYEQMNIKSQKNVQLKAEIMNQLENNSQIIIKTRDNNFVTQEQIKCLEENLQPTLNLSENQIAKIVEQIIYQTV
eukprot:TRINITY_DN6222_c0_g1_i1.p1 TRINITY_DN6222_c0_g1~~TRINITY_DN6222_c0_g1_i1.p1  ORF type:complete len:165 (+),score=36.12 TRINITY_DN6222_c0_g1_i1:7-501(+)